eukprot:1159621-Pelagomonas_calceolata.AAC.13
MACKWSAEGGQKACRWSAECKQKACRWSAECKQKACGSADQGRASLTMILAEEPSPSKPLGTLLQTSFPPGPTAKQASDFQLLSAARPTHRNMFVRASAIARRFVVESQAAKVWAKWAYGTTCPSDQQACFTCTDGGCLR